MILKTYLSIKKKCSDCIQIVPASVIVIGMLCGAVPFCPVKIFSSHIATIIIPCFVFLLSLSLLTKKSVPCLLVSTIIGVLSALLFLKVLHADYTKRLDKPTCGAVIQCQIKDPKCCGPEISWLPNPSYIQAEVRKIRFTEKSDWRVTSGRTLIKLPPGGHSVAYGSTLELQGYFSSPPDPVVPGDFNFKNYLLTRDCSLVFYAQKIACSESYTQKTPISTTIVSFFLAGRNYLLKHVVSQLNDVDNKHILAALLFGCKQGLSWQEQQSFIRSGTIHIFAISGLHVGLFALILFWTFRWLPFSLRYLLVPLCLAVYVGTIGFQPSAVRALIMIATWSILRAFIVNVNPLNTVFLAAAVILAISPFAYLDIGFQYSFLVTAFLVQSWQATKKWLQLSGEKVRWMPQKDCSNWTHQLFKWRSVFLATLIATLTACLASSALTLYYRGLLIPLAIINNLIVQPFVWLVFILSVLKALFSFWLPLSWLLARGINFLLSIITEFIALTSSESFSSYILSPPIWTIPLFLLALFLTTCSYRKKQFIVSSIMLIFIVMFWCFRGQVKPGQLYLFHGGQFQEPAIVVLPTGNNGAYLLNPGGIETSRIITSLLERLGEDHVSQLVICKSRKEYCQGIPFVFCRLPINRLVIPQGFRRSYYVKKSVNIASRNGTRIVIMSNNQDSTIQKYQSPALHLVTDSDFYSAFISLPTLHLQLKCKDDGNGNRLLSVKNNRGLDIKLKLQNTNRLYYQVIDI